METRRTTNCHRHGHAEFRIQYDPKVVPVENDVRWFLAWLEEAVARGQRFVDGQTCQVGWLITQIRAIDDGSLAIWEPDMKEVPVAWIDSVSHTLHHLRLQKDVCESVLNASDLSFPSMRQSAIVCTRLGPVGSIRMDRAKSSDTISGWFCGCRQEDHNHNDPAELRRVSLYEVAVRYTPRVIPFLALPVGTLLQVRDDGLELFLQDQRLHPKPRSFLARVQERGQDQSEL
jgi:hypothetical protein